MQRATKTQPALDDASRAVLLALVRLSGARKCWVRTDRVLAAVSRRKVAYHQLLDFGGDWRGEPELREYALLIDMMAMQPSLVEGCGNFGAVDAAPSAPVFNRCRPTARGFALAAARDMKAPG